MSLHESIYEYTVIAGSWPGALPCAQISIVIYGSRFEIARNSDRFTYKLYEKLYEYMPLPDPLVFAGNAERG